MEKALDTVSSTAAAVNDDTDVGSVNADGVQERRGRYQTGLTVEIFKRNLCGRLILL